MTTRLKVGMARAARTARITMTTMSSRRVNAL
jgi:hypothetical protein